MKKIILVLLFVAMLIPPTAQGDTVVEVKFSFDLDSINSTKMLVTGNIPLNLSVGSEEVEVVDGVAEFSTNVFLLGDVLSVKMDGNAIQNIEIPAEEYVHVVHVYAKWTGGQPPPLQNVGLGQGTLLVLERLLEESPSVPTNTTGKQYGEIVLNAFFGSDTDYDKDGNGVLLTDPFGLLQFLFGMKDHLNLAAQSADATTSFKNNVSATAPLFDQMFEGGTVTSFQDILNTSETLAAVVYQHALDIVENGTSSNVGEKVQALTDALKQLRDTVHKAFVGPREHTFSGSVQVTLQDTTSSEQSQTSEEESPLLAIGILLAVPFLLKRKIRKYD